MLLQRLSQFAEQPGVLYGDDSLRGEVRHKRNLLLGERAYLLAKDGNCAYEFFILQHRYDNESARTGKLDQHDRRRVALLVGRVLGVVGNVDQLLCCSRPSRPCQWTELNERSAVPDGLGEGRRRIVHRADAEQAVLIKLQKAELGFANARRIRQHGIEHRLKLARRT